MLVRNFLQNLASKPIISFYRDTINRFSFNYHLLTSQDGNEGFNITSKHFLFGCLAIIDSIHYNKPVLIVIVKEQSCHLNRRLVLPVWRLVSK